MLSFKITSKLRFLAVSFLLLQFGKVNAQCETCSTTITSNSPSSYTVSAGQTVCVAKGFDFTGTITLNGGTLCNSGTVHNINFNSGTFDNYGLYSKLTGTIALNNTAPLTINNYSTIELNNLDFGNGSNATLNTYSKMVVNGWLDIHRDSEEDLITMNVFNSLDEKSTANLNVIKDFTLTKGRLTMNVSNNSKICAKVECTGFVNIGGQFTVNNSAFVLIVNPNGIFNVKKAVSLDGKKNKEINNAGTINFASDFNVGGNGQNTGLISINNLFRSTFNINGNINLNYNNGTVNFVNNQEGFLNVGKSFNISKQNNNFTNNGKMLITKDLILENGTFTNNSGINIRTVEIKNGILTNNRDLNISRDLFTTNNSGVINNNSTINVGRNFINTSTVNLGKKSVITTLNYENEGNSVINGPTNINGDNGGPDSTNYASVIISGNSKNSGYINNYVLVYDKTSPTNSSVGFDDFGNPNRIGSNVIVIRGSIRCIIPQIFAVLSASVNPSTVCSGNEVTLNASASLPWFFGDVPISYSWDTNPVSNVPTINVKPINSGTQPITQNYVVTTTYTLLGGTCTKTRTLVVTVNPSPAISITGDSTICAGQSTTLTASGATNYLWNTGSNNSTIIVSPTSTTSYGVIVNGLYGCTASANFTIKVNPLPTVNIGANPSTSIYLEDGSVTLTASGANQYLWSPLSEISSDTGNIVTVSPKSTTTYYVTGTDSNSCSSIDSIAIVYNPLLVQIEKSEEFNPGEGFITLVPSGGIPPYQLSWNTGLTENTIYDLNYGNYSVLITDSIGDSITKTITLGKPSTYTLQQNLIFQDGAISKEDLEQNSGLMVLDSYIDANSDGSHSFTISDVNTDFNFIYREATKSTLKEAPITKNYQEIVRFTKDQMLSFTSKEIANLNIIDTTVTDSIRVLKTFFATNSSIIAKKPEVLSTAHGIAFKDGKLYTLTNGFTLFKPVVINNGDLIELGKSSSRLYVNVNSKEASVSNLLRQPVFAIDFVLNSQQASVSRIISGGNLIIIEIPTPYELCLADVNKNWNLTRTYDELGNIVAEMKEVSDYMDRPIQSINKNFVTQNVLVSQTIYDNYGRGVIQTLPAPSFQQNVCFVDGFVQDLSSINYTFNDFDIPDYTSNNTSLTFGEINKPAQVNNATQGTLGWYYSNNNTAEPFVATTNIPYSRVTYSETKPGVEIKVATAGDQLCNGTGHESYGFSMPIAGDLNLLYGNLAGWTLTDFNNVYGAGYTPATGVSGINTDYTPSFSIMATKDISVDQNGNESVSFSDIKGNLLATCLSGQVNGANVQTQHIAAKIAISKGFNYVDIHLPLGCENTLMLYNNASNAYTYNIIDLKTDQYLKFSGSIDFAGTTPSIPAGFYRIILKNTVFGMPSSIPLSYDLNYYNFSINYYDRAGRLKMNIPPAGIDKSYTYSYNTNTYHDQKSLFQNPTTGSTLNNYSFDNTAVQKNFTVAVPAVQSGASQMMNITVGYGGGSHFSGGPPVLDNIIPNATTRLAGGTIFHSGDIMDPVFSLDSMFLHPEPQQTIIGGASGGGRNIIAEHNYVMKFEVVDQNNNLIQDNLGHPLTGTINSYLDIYDNGYAWLSYKGNPMFPYTRRQDLTSLTTGPYTFNINPAIANNLTSVKLKITSIDYYNFVGASGILIQSYPLESYINYFGFSLTASTFGLPALPNHTMAELYDYDSFDQLLSQTTPDKGKEEYIYGTDGKARFLQNSLQATTNKYSYTDYDYLNRPTEVGEYNYNSSGTNTNYYFDNYYATLTANSVRNIVEANSLDPDRKTDVSYVTYDVADPNFYTETGLSASLYKQRFTSGLASKTYNDNKLTWYSYDERGRIEWIVMKVKNMNGKKSDKVVTINYEYDFFDNITKKIYQKESSGEKFYHHYEFDRNKSLKRVYTSTDGINKSKHAEFDYYLQGSLKRYEIGNKLQGLDYVYTINGWLKSVNSPEMGDKDPGRDGVQGAPRHIYKDLFGYSLDYFAGDYQRLNSKVQTYDTPELYQSNPGTYTSYSNNMYNGLIKGTRWQTYVQNSTLPLAYKNVQLMYAHKYDNKYQLTESNFGTITNTGSLNYTASSSSSYIGPIFNSLNDYKVNNLVYDDNGNIQSLNRNGYTAGAGLALDNLTYHYLPNTNKLDYVGDASADAYTGFELKAGQTTGNYQYDNIGRLIADVKEGKYYTYDFKDRITAVYSDAAKVHPIVSYAYDEGGFRIEKIEFTSSGIDKTWYVRNEDGELLSTYSQHETTSITGPLIQNELEIYANSRIGVYYPALGGKYIYELNDHLGNVRTTFEPQALNTFITGYDGTGATDYLFDYNNSNDNTFDISGVAGTSVKTVYPNTQYGSGITLKVYPGEQISASISHYYTGSANAMLAFSVSNSSGQIIQWETVPLSSTINAWQQISKTITVGNFPGDLTLVIFPWNLSSNPVWWDNLSVNTVAGTNGLASLYVPHQLDISNYYPHGSVMPGLNYENAIAYRYGYQGQFTEKEKAINETSFELRNYNHFTGRFNSTDPYQQNYSPFMGMGNSPINIIDKDGGYGATWTGALIGAGAGLALAGIADYSKDGKLFNEKHKLLKYGGAAAGGFLLGGIVGGLIDAHWGTKQTQFQGQFFNRVITDKRYGFGFNWEKVHSHFWSHHGMSGGYRAGNLIWFNFKFGKPVFTTKAWDINFPPPAGVTGNYIRFFERVPAGTPAFYPKSGPTTVPGMGNVHHMYFGTKSIFHECPDDLLPTKKGGWVRRPKRKR